MAKTTNAKALVPACQRKTSVMRGAATFDVAPAMDGTLLPILGSDLAVAKLIGDGGDVMREGGVVLVTGRAYATRAGVVAAEEIFYDQAARQDGKGPWLGEEAKVRCRDEACGFDCRSDEAQLEK